MSPEQFIAALQDAVDACPEIILVCLDITSLQRIRQAYGHKMALALRDSVAGWLASEEAAAYAFCRLEDYLYCLWLDNRPGLGPRAAAGKFAKRFLRPWKMTLHGNSVSALCDAVLAVVTPERHELLGKNLLEVVYGSLAISRSGNSIFIHDRKTRWQDHEHDRMANCLRDCVKHDMAGFSAVFHPIAELNSGAWTGLETLCRWHHPELGLVSPLVFIPEAERQGLIIPLERWLLKFALEQCLALGLDKLPTFFLTVNISPLQLMDDKFCGFVVQTLKKLNFSAGKLCLEVKDEHGLTFSDFARRTMQALQEQGINIIFDDFGFGHQSLKHLGDLPINGIKCERSIFQDFSGQLLSSLLSSSAEIARSNGLRLIIKGLETAEHIELCKDKGILLGQGYMLSKPLTADALKLSRANFAAPQTDLDRLIPEKSSIDHWLRQQSHLMVSADLFKLFDHCADILLSEKPLSDTLTAILGMMGRHFGVSGAFVFLQNDEGLYSVTNEWCPPGVQSQAHVHQGVTIHPSLLQCFKEDGMFISPDVTELSTPLYSLMSAYGVRAAIMLPIWQKDRLLGFLGFNDVRHRDWPPEAVILLWNLCLMIAEKGTRDAAKANSLDRPHILKDILNGSGLNVVVSDLETDEILWVNDKVKAQYDIGHMLVGRKCYEILQGRSERCPFCRVPELIANPNLGQLTFEHHNKYWNKTFVVYNSILTWEDGKQAHAEYTLDITEQRQNQSQLEYFATTDALTGVLNRNALLSKLKEALKTARQKEQKLSVVFVDVDRLKLANDLYGHNVGDGLLLSAVEAIRTCVRKDDLIGRLGGDEFLIVFPNCRKKLAASRINRARNRLLRNKLPNDEAMTFSFGVAENSELVHADCAEPIRELLEISDARMREYKLATVSHANIR